MGRYGPLPPGLTWGLSPPSRTVIPSIFEVAGPAGDVRFAQELMERTWAVYGQMTGLDLTQLIHESEGPWHKIRKRYPDLRTVGIPNWMIRKHFRVKLQANHRRVADQSA